MKCEILVTTKEGQDTAGFVILDGKKLSVLANKGYERLMKNIMDETHTINEEEVSAREDSRSWFKTLPEHYGGHRLMAIIVGEE
jgi:hypothetical protein